MTERRIDAPLARRTCVPCRTAVSPLTAEEAARRLEETPGWELDEDAKAIRRRFRFPDFAAAAVFVGRVAAVAEEEGHHPDIAFGWGYCTVTFRTHRIGGLHENDFIMAAKVDALGPAGLPETPKPPTPAGSGRDTTP